MLEKIVNISAGSDYKNSASKSGRYSRGAQFLHTLQSSMSDSVSFSPAVTYLTSINWKLKKINKDKENLIITFDYDDFEFCVNVGFPELAITNRFNYNIKKIVEKIYNKVDLSVNLETPILNREIQQSNSSVKLYYFNSFINGLIELNETVIQVSSTSFEVQKLLRLNEKQIKSELELMNENILIFIEKYLSIKLRNNPIIEPGDDNISLHKVQIIKI